MQNLMARGNAGGLAQGQNLTRYFSLTGDEAVGVNENTAQALIRGAQTWGRLRAYIQANSFAAGNATTLAFRKNGVTSTNVTISIDGGVTGIVEDLTGSESLADGDLTNYIITAPNVAGSITISWVQSLMDGATGIFCASNQAGVTIAASTTTYSVPDGGLTGYATEAWAQMATRESTTLSNLRGWVSSIGTGGALTVRTRKGAADGAQVITWTGVTGAQEDPTNTDSFANGDLLDYSEANTNTAGTTTIRLIHCKHTGAQSFLGTGNQGAVTVGSGLTRDYLVEGDLEPTATEAQALMDAGASREVSKMRVYLSANTINGDSTFTLRKNSANTALAVTFVNATTGVQEDLVDTISYIDTDDISTRLVTLGTMNTLLPRLIQYVQADPAVAVSRPHFPHPLRIFGRN